MLTCKVQKKGEKRNDRSSRRSGLWLVGGDLIESERKLQKEQAVTTVVEACSVPIPLQTGTQNARATGTTTTGRRSTMQGNATVT